MRAILMCGLVLALAMTASAQPKNPRATKKEIDKDEQLLGCYGGNKAVYNDDAFYAAVFDGNTDCVDLILDDQRSMGVDITNYVNRPTKDGYVPIYAAAFKGRVHILKKLIRAGANVNHIVHGSVTPLLGAVQNGFAGAAEALLKAGANPHGVAISKGAADRETKADVTPLFLAAEKGQSGIVALLLDAGAFVDRQRYDGFTALHVASQKGFYQVIRQLLNHGANPNLKAAGGANALHYATDAHAVHALHLLADQRPSSLDRPKEPFAERKPLAAGVKRVRADIEARDDKGRTALMMAAQKGYDHCAQVLLENGANPIAENTMDRGATPLDYAAKHGWPETLRTLLKSMPRKDITESLRTRVQSYSDDHIFAEDVAAVFDTFLGNDEM